MKKNNHMKTFLTVLFFGAIWGIVEATLGTILHLPAIRIAGIWGGATTILVPIAFAIMGMYYKQSGNARGIAYMGILVAGIKAIVCAIFALSLRPCAYILLESLAFAGVVAFVKPKELISWKMFGCFALANTVYLLSASFIQFAPFQYGSAKWIEYAVYSNLIAIGYTLVVGLIAYLIKTFVKTPNIKLDKVILKPYIPLMMTCLALVCTLVLR